MFGTWLWKWVETMPAKTIPTLPLMVPVKEAHLLLFVPVIRPGHMV